MHCELLVPALLAPQGQPAETRSKMPALELLLALGRRSRSEPRSAERWLLEGFGLTDQPLAAGALTLIGAGMEAGEDFWVRADPVHLQLGRDSLRLVPSSAFAIQREEADALCLSLSGHFSSALELVAVDAHRWCARLKASALLEMHFSGAAPLALAGTDVDGRLKSGEVPADWHAFLNEAQMLLHAHPVNEAREARGELAINSVWLWGSGRAPKDVHAPWSSVSAAEPIALGLARLAGKRTLQPAACAADWVRSLPGEGRHLAVLDSLRVPSACGDAAACQNALSVLERDWFAPLLEALKQNHIGMLSIHVPDAAECESFETVRGDLRRFWRRTRPLSAYSPSSE